MHKGTRFTAASVELEWFSSKETLLKRRNESFLLYRIARCEADSQTKILVTIEDMLLNVVTGVIIQVPIGNCGSVNTRRDQRTSASASPGV